MTRTHSRIGDAAAAAKQKATTVIDATADLAETAVAQAAAVVHRAGDSLHDASASLGRATVATDDANARALKLVD